MNERVPVIDFTNAADPVGRGALVQSIGEALEAFGFVAISGHGIRQETLDQAYRAAAELFAQDGVVKQRYETPEDGRQRGYTPFGVEHAKDQPIGDLKEFWHVGRPGPPPGIPCNQWPAEVPAFEVVFGDLFAQMERFADQLLEVIAQHLQLPADFFAPRTAGGNSVLRVIHYPPVQAAVAGAVRAAQHEDINLITVLPVSTAPGLELLTREGKWLAVQPPEGTVVCDTGDMMQLLTGGLLPATTHRVVNPSEGDRGSRFSLPFFMHPRPECRLDPIDGSSGGMTAGQFLAERLRQTGMQA